MLGEQIRSIRKSQKISINNLSKLTGISLGYLSDLENNKAKNPSLDKIKLIAKTLNVSVEDLLCTEPEAYTSQESADFKNIEFTTPIEAIEFLLKQPTITKFAEFNIDDLSDKDKLNFANELLQHLKLLSYKYKK